MVEQRLSAEDGGLYTSQIIPSAGVASAVLSGVNLVRKGIEPRYEEDF